MNIKQTSVHFLNQNQTRTHTMYRLLLLCCVLASAQSLATESVISELIEKFAQKLCTKSSQAAKEMYGELNYYVMYSIPSDATATVLIKQNFLHTTAHRRNGGKIFEDVKILPSIAQTADAVYTLDNRQLQVIIPYKVDIGTDYVKSCKVLNNNVINVPLVINPPFYYRFKNVTEN
ncbi:uncharacterized protein LOC112048354 [Bicyclus anynana]|uniref:Uncharacterized protein LOC112048354 n=1 Tax=Bicyclus anynana TaxID=110368 RepID=A0A6J1NER9_BICAN|nr:uncharacterized protein LOC112048354 [Bicyclus anynana]